MATNMSARIARACFSLARPNFVFLSMVVSERSEATERERINLLLIKKKDVSACALVLLAFFE